MEQNKELMKRQIKRLQDNLLSIRRIAGWTAEELGDRIGVTKQTISNLENKKVDLTQMQYIAIRAILDYEIGTNKENTVLPQVISILLDSNDEIAEEKETEMKTAIEAIAATAVGGIAGAQLAAVAGALLSPLGLVGVAIVGVKLGWLKPLMKNKKRQIKLINKIEK